MGIPGILVGFLLQVRLGAYKKNLRKEGKNKEKANSMTCVNQLQPDMHTYVSNKITRISSCVYFRLAI